MDPIAEPFPAETIASFLPVAQQSISPEAVALGIFGGIAALATLLIAGLMIGRLIRVGADELETMRALGAHRAMLVGHELLGALAALSAGSPFAGGVPRGPA